MIIWITFLFCLLLSALSPGIAKADNGGQADCRRCHTVLPTAHAPVADDGLACLQCHAGHSVKRSVGKSPKGASRADRGLGSAVDRIGCLVLLVGILGPVIHGLLFIGSSALRKFSCSAKIVDKAKSHSGLLRGWHVINAATVVFLSVTGLGLRWGLTAASGRIVAWHSFAGGVHVMAWSVWLGFNVITGCYVGRYLRPTGGWGAGITRQIVYYSWGIFRGRRHPYPYGGFNPLQSAVYLLVMGLLLPVVMVSGLGLLSLRAGAFANIESWGHLLVEVHFLAGCLLLAFLSVHLYLAVWGPEGKLWRRQYP